MKFSIIVATYNSSKTISECIDSILQQSFKNFEIIVQDGGSSDSTVEIVEAFNDDRIKLHQVPDEGIYDAYNKGLARAVGDIVGFLNSDDLFSNPNILQQMYDAASVSTDIIIASVGIFRIEDEINKQIFRKYSVKPSALNHLWLWWQPPHPGFYVSRRLLGQVEYFNTKYAVAGDFDFIIRSMQANNAEIAIIEDIAVLMRDGGFSALLQNRLRGNKEIIVSYLKNGLWYALPFYFLRFLRKLAQFK